MTYLQIKLPDSLLKNLQKIAEEDNISLEEFVTSAISEKIALNESYLQERAQKGNQAKYQAILAKVPNIKPESYDQLPEA